jgi:2-amino-4-hydroxy-6-hydroxymethyldihydropteridine diphosphokinase
MALRAVVGLGANVGDRLATMRASVRAIEEIARVEARSRVYETAPVGGPEQPAFLNAALLASFDGAPIALLEHLLGIEARLGRVRVERWGPRVIDLDVLWIDGVVIDTPRLVVPHPRLHERAFAVKPLLDVAPGARDRAGTLYLPPPGEVRDTGERL